MYKRQAPAPAPAGPPRSLGEAWSRFLEELAGTHGSLADVLRRRGRLEELSEERAVIHLDGLRASERRMARDARNRRAAARAFSGVAGRAIEVTLDDGQESSSEVQDEFTREVRDLFGGAIEDRG